MVDVAGPDVKAMTAAASSADAVLRPGLLPGVAPQSDAERVPHPPIPPEVSDLEPSVYRFILKHSMKQQILPLFQGGQLLTIIFFMFMQDPILGAAAIALYPLQGYIIPKLQFKVNQLGKQRVRTVRIVADKVQESASGIIEIQANDTVKLNLTDFAHILGIIYDIRFEIYKRKFFAKFLNNFIGQLTPFFFYSLGGYLVIKGDLSFGALVAILAAYKDLASPWKELLDFYQIKENSRITYEQIVEQFQPAGMADAGLLLAEPEKVLPLTGELSVANLSLAEDDRSRVVDAVSFTVKLDEHVAVIGQSGSGKSELALLLARLVRPSSGRITVGGADK